MAKLVVSTSLLLRPTYIRRFAASLSSLRCLHSSQRCRAKEGVESAEEQPIKFSTSRAANWGAIDSFGAPPRNYPIYQPLIITGSMAVFIIYFLFLREENDLDEELNYSLFERVPGLEEHQLRAALKYNLEHNGETADIEKRLQEVMAKRKESAASKN